MRQAYDGGMTDAEVLAAAATRSSGALTVVATLAFVAACFAVVELLDRRSRRSEPRAFRPTRSGHDLGVDGPMADVSSDPHPFGFGGPRAPRPLARALTVSLLGVVAAGALGAALIPLRASVGQAGIALSLVLVVVAAAAAGGRLAAAITAAGAALTFNLLHTEPYLTFHMSRTTDLVASVLMIVVGVAVGEVSQSAGSTGRRRQEPQPQPSPSERSTTR